MLKVSLEETFSTIPQIPIYTKSVFSRDTFHYFTNFNLYYVSFKFDFILNLQKTPSTIPKKLDVYSRCVFKRHLLLFHKIQYILKESLKKKHCTIPKKLDLYWRCLFHNFTNFNLHYYVSLKFDFILRVSLQKTHSIIPTKLNLYWRCFFKRHFPQFHKI